MDAFKVHDQLIKDYRSFTEGFVEIRDNRVADHVEQQAAGGAQWPAPRLALNPAFAAGGRIDELVRDGTLHQECERIFRPKRSVDDWGDTPITLHQHQRDAVDVARTGASYVLTTGTGSGKSLDNPVVSPDRGARSPATPSPDSHPSSTSHPLAARSRRGTRGTRGAARASSDRPFPR